MELKGKLKIFKGHLEVCLKEFKTIKRQLNFIDKEHNLSSDEIETLEKAYDLLNKLDDEIYFKL